MPQTSYRVVDNTKNKIPRTETDVFEDACTVAKVMSQETKEQNCAAFFVMDDSSDILAMFYKGIKFTPTVE